MARLVLILSLLLATPALAEPQCFPRDELVQTLATKYHESEIARGVANNGVLVEIFASRDGLTWTLFVTLPGGVSCPLTDGESWQITGDMGEPS